MMSGFILCIGLGIICISIDVIAESIVNKKQRKLIKEEIDKFE